MAFQPPPLTLKRRDGEKLLEAMEKGIAEEFRRRLSRGEAPAAGVDIRTLLGSIPPIPTLRFERQAPSGSATKSRAREEAYAEMLLRNLRDPWPVQSASCGLSDAERIYGSPPDFRTEGEKRRDARQAAARLEPLRRHTSPMDKLLVSALGGEKERKAKAQSSKKRKAEQVWEETTAQARKLNALTKRIKAGEANPLEEAIAIAALPDSLAGLSPKLQQSRAEAREKVLEMFEKGQTPEVVPLGEGASFEQNPPKLPSDEFVAEAVVEANRILQAPGNTASFEDGKYVVRDKNGNVLMEATVVYGAGFHQRDLSGEISSNVAPKVSVGLQATLAPPYKEYFSIAARVYGPLSVGLVVGEDEGGQTTFGVRVQLGLVRPPIPMNVSGPYDPSKITEAFDPGG